MIDEVSVTYTARGAKFDLLTANSSERAKILPRRPVSAKLTR